MPEDIGHALGIDAGGSVRVLRLLWTANGEPAAVSTTYLAAGAVLTTLGPGDAPSADTELTVAPVAVGPEANQDGEGSRQRAWQPRALIVEMQQPPNSVARKLGVPVGQPAVMVMVRFDDPELERPAAVTISVLRPELFRIVVESPASPQSESSDGQTSDAWAHALEDWNP